jgi:CheY-like chemotaxis protein
LVQPGAAFEMTGRDDGDLRPSILVVEDNLDMQTYLHNLLNVDYECLVTGNGRDGLEVALEQVPDLIVSDVMMPEMDGYELTQTLKEDQRTSHIPIIMLTARSDKESRLKGLREHADDYLTKPFDDEELLLRIANQLAARDIIKARFSGRIYLDEPLATELNQRERDFLERFEDLLKQGHADPDLDIGAMASRMAISIRQLQRKLKALTGHSPAEYLRAYRLKRAAELLGGGGQIVQIALDVGFSSQAYFGTCFKAQFGLSPKQFQLKKS